MMNLVSPSCLWFVLAPKVFQLCTNHLVLVLCKSVWIVQASQFFLVPFRSSNTPLYPSKVLQAKEHAPTPYFSIFFNLDSHLNLARSRQHVNKPLELSNFQILFILFIFNWLRPWILTRLKKSKISNCIKLFFVNIHVYSPQHQICINLFIWQQTNIYLLMKKYKYNQNWIKVSLWNYHNFNFI
jgi:hypothetical protein